MHSAGKLWHYWTALTEPLYQSAAETSQAARAVLDQMLRGPYAAQGLEMTMVIQIRVDAKQAFSQHSRGLHTC